MKALFLADLYQLWINFKFYAGFLVVALGITAFSGPNDDLRAFFPMYAVFMCSMIGMSLLQLDEASRWNICAQTLPCTRRDQVTGKYALTLACFAATWALFALLYVLLAALGRMAWPMVAVQSLLMLAVGLLAPAVSLPALFRWGSAKGRVIYIFMVVFVVAGVGGAVGGLINMKNVALPMLPMPILIALAVVIPVLIFLASWSLSVRWYEHREL